MYDKKLTILSILATELLEVIRKFNSLESIVAIGSDNCGSNTGPIKGAIRSLELRLKRPLQWLICLGHENELPLRHLIENLGK